MPIVGRFPQTPSAWWNDVDIDTLHFKSSHLPFSKEFSTDYQTFSIKLVLNLVNMKDTLLLRALMLQEVEQGRHDNGVRELEANLKRRWMPTTRAKGCFSPSNMTRRNGRKGWCMVRLKKKRSLLKRNLWKISKCSSHLRKRLGEWCVEVNRWGCVYF